MPGFFWVAVLVSITPPYVMLIRVRKLHFKKKIVRYRLLPTVSVLVLAAGIYFLVTCHMNM
jgi:hypothetical protein